MTLKAIFIALKKIIVTTAKAVFKRVADMKADQVAKVGALVAGAGVTVWLYAKSFKDHMKIVKKDSVIKDSMNLVDRGLYNNYNDTRNIDDLDSLLLKLRKSMDNKDKIMSGKKKGKKKLKNKLSNKKKDQLVALGSRFDTTKTKRMNILAELDQFKRDIERQDRDDEDEYIYNNYRVEPLGFDSDKNFFEMNPAEQAVFLNTGI